MTKAKNAYYEVKEYIEKQSGCYLLTTFEEYTNKSMKLKITCSSCDENYFASFSRFKSDNKYTCNKCSIKRVREAHRFTIEDVIKIIENVETGNGCKYVSGAYENNTSLLLIECACGNEFETNLAQFGHSNKRQCNTCGIAKKGWKYTHSDATRVIEENGCRLLTAETEYLNSSQKLKIECSCGNTFEKSLSQLLYRESYRCHNCYLESSDRYKIPYNEIKHYVEVESESNCKIVTTEEDYINTKKNIVFQCECGEEFYTSIHEFRSGNQRRCKICSKAISKGENKVKQHLLSLSINFNMQYSFADCKHKNPLPFDFAILSEEEIKLLIEYDGELHYKEVESFGGIKNLQSIQLRDGIKTQYCIDNNIPLLRIPYWDFDSIESIINDKLKELNILT